MEADARKLAKSSDADMRGAKHSFSAIVCHRRPKTLRSPSDRDTSPHSNSKHSLWRDSGEAAQLKRFWDDAPFSQFRRARARERGAEGERAESGRGATRWPRIAAPSPPFPAILSDQAARA